MSETVVEPGESLPPAEIALEREDPFLHVLGKHQLGSAVSTLVDYAFMIFMVSVVGIGPVWGTVIGASCGAVTNFSLNRWFIFKAAHRTARGQALRYALVSGGSLLWNAMGEHLLAVELGVQYVLARLMVGLLTSLLWNFPMHRHFVFRR